MSMTTIHVTTNSRLSPERVLAAGHDFTARRAEIFPAVSTPHLEVHDLSQTSADVTEGTPAGVGINWERCRYDWSQPGSVKAIVTDSNVDQPANSSWELRATPAASGSKVEMIWIREFTHNARRRIFGTLFKLVGKLIFTREAKRTIRNLKSLEASTA
jgi:Polyketide cyclase / dehydrase and lipid transport